MGPMSMGSCEYPEGGGLICLHDRSLIRATLETDPALHLYALGDLDPLFFPRTQWFGWLEKSGLEFPQIGRAHV